MKAKDHARIAVAQVNAEHVRARAMTLMYIQIGKIVMTATEQELARIATEEGRFRKVTLGDT